MTEDVKFVHAWEVDPRGTPAWIPRYGDPQTRRHKGAEATGALVAGAMLFSPVSKTTHARFLDLHLLGTLHSSFHNKVMFSQMVGNVLLLSWLGFLLPFAFRRMRPWMAALAVMLTSVGIETVQYVIAVGRVSSVSDIFFNTVGGVVGAVLAKLLGARLPAERPRTMRPIAGYGTVPS